MPRTSAQHVAGRTLTLFRQQPSILHRDHRLGGKVFQQRDVLVGEAADFLAIERE